MGFERTEKALFLIEKGYTAKEIVKLCGYSNISSVFNLAKSHNLKVTKANTHKHEAMRRYKAEGHTMQEVADRFNVAKGTAQQICKGIAPQQARPPKNGYVPPNKGKLQEIEYVKNMIAERCPNFEYEGNYTGSDGYVDLKCKVCGKVIKRSWWAVRKSRNCCPYCLEEERRKERERKRTEQQQKQEQQKIEAEQNKRGKAVVRLLTNAVKLHRCPVCGTLTTNKTYCSVKCNQKANEARKDAARRSRISGALKDKDISLERLYKRDKGICHICGGKCDWSDHTYKGRYFIVGKHYPSIDHVIPLAKGGEHSWGNVKLAHFSCNSAKGASLVG